MNKPLILPIKTSLGYYIYETGRNEVIAVNSELFSYIQAIQHDDIPAISEASDAVKAQYEQLVECGYLSQGRVMKVEHPATHHLEQYLGRNMEKVTLQITQSCNLRCKYCIYSENSNLSQRSHSSNKMTFDTAKKALDFYWDHSRDSDSALIGFYGGEPLLEYPLIVKIVEYAERIFAGKKISFHVTTNATLLTDEMIDFFLEHNFSMTFSLDGPREAQNRNRVFPNGNGTFDLVMDAITRMYEKDPNKFKDANLSMVIDPVQDYEGFLKLINLPCFDKINVIYGPVEVDAEPLGFSSEFVAEHNYDQFLGMVKYYRNSEQGYRNHVEKERVESFDIDIGKMSTINLGPVATPGGPCIPGKIRLLVDCFGNFYPCEKVDEDSCMRMGSLDKGFDFEKIRYLLNVGQVNPEQCKSCWAFSLCNICARAIDDGEKLSATKRFRACQRSKSSALLRIQEKILDYEHQEHEKQVKHWEEGVTV